MNNLHSVFSRSRRPELDALPEFQGHELERGGRSSSQFNETPFPTPIDSSISSSRASVATTNPRYQQGEHDDTVSAPHLAAPSVPHSGSRSRIGPTTGRDVSNALQALDVDAENAGQRPKLQSEPSSNGIFETPYTTNGASPYLVPSSPASSQKNIRRSKKSKHFPGISFKTSQLPKFTGPSRLGRFKPSLTLENSGSVARDHLASERTFLAYVRTSLALASMGVAIVQLFTIADLASNGTDTQITAASKKVQRFARPLGVTAVLLALIVLSIAVVRYFLVQRALPQKVFPVARFSIAFLAFSLGAIVVVIFAALLSGGTIS